MLSDLPLFKMLTVNVILGTLWHVAMFIVCIRSEAAFSPDKKHYRPHKWERGGKFYADVFKINRWKDLLPQYVGKGGFSKEHLEDVSIEYIDRFIIETCRGEWNHTMNCLFALPLFILNQFWPALLMTCLLLLGNLPFVAIQRYNRFRLQKLRKLVLRKTDRQTAVPASSLSEDF